MKKAMIILLGGALCACLAGCSQPAPTRAADGLAWSEDWVSVGNVIGVETPDGMDPRENNEALAANGMYYATWSIGEAVPYTNADGDEAQLYDAQLYLLLAGYDAAEKAEENAAQWLDMASGQYQTEQSFTGEYNGQSFTVITYACAAGTNPYARGASAFGVYGNYAVSVELLCQEDAGIDPQTVLSDFLQNCHYAA